MIIYFLPNGELWNAILDSNRITTNIEPTSNPMEIDEIKENKDLIINLSQQASQKDENGLGRWYVENGELFERDNWTPFEGQ